ncbi:FAD/NAD(P)-binding domain-containing protein [Pleurotus eryngii]|uniref:FAD/NAD(P)-binding domain-containing protein n=1 Tax=Pleurotus eryngii TaxID=5323 RepID=A0A9P6D8G0_PLEER|nr:FAD/NAD(P)-binding domain-containing protein [Pleurotus eryngii]
MTLPISICATTIAQDVAEYLRDSARLIKEGRIFKALSPLRTFELALNIVYIAIQGVIIMMFKPPSSKCRKTLAKPYGRIAVIGAGLTGVSSAAHCVAHNFEAVIYEENSRDELGGIWAHVNSTSGLQLNSMLYRFHPAVLWRKAFPQQKDIVGEITRVWKEYGLESRTKFNTEVKSVRRVPDDEKTSSQPEWIINDGEDGVFNAVIVTVGTCGKPKWIKIEGMPEDVGNDAEEHEEREDKCAAGPFSYATAVKTEYEAPHQDDGKSEDDEECAAGPFSYAAAVKHEHPLEGPTDQRDEEDDSNKTNGSGRLNGTKLTKHTNQRKETFAQTIIHSSQLDTIPGWKLEGKNVVVIGSGASGVESVETVLERVEGGKGGNVWMVARSDKWIIPRNIVIDTVLACQPFGREMPLSFLWEFFLTHWHYRGVKDLVPTNKGIFEGTPVVNDEFLEHVRTGRCVYVRGDPVRCTKNGVVVNDRKRGMKLGDRGREIHLDADIIVLATGFEKPDISFLDDGLFPDGYERPDLYLQNFSTEDWSILMTNSAYQNAIGTVGHFHIGIYTRILLVLLMDEGARPTPKDMRLWVDVVRFIKRGASGGAFGFFTYAELTIWLLGFHLLRPDRLRWILFIMQGWGVHPK